MLKTPNGKTFILLKCGSPVLESLKELKSTVSFFSQTIIVRFSRKICSDLDKAFNDLLELDGPSQT